MKHLIAFITKLGRNYAKPTPKFWRKVGDFFLLMTPIVFQAVLDLPDEILPAHNKVWIAFASAMICPGLKTLTNFAHEGES